MADTTGSASSNIMDSLAQRIGSVVNNVADVAQGRFGGFMPPADPFNSQTSYTFGPAQPGSSGFIGNLFGTANPFGSGPGGGGSMFGAKDPFGNPSMTGTFYGVMDPMAVPGQHKGDSLAGDYGSWSSFAFGKPKDQSKPGTSSATHYSGKGDPSDTYGLGPQLDSLDDQFKRAGQEAGIPWQVVKAIAGIESGGNQGAGSPDGAQGVMQIMPNYWGGLAEQFGGLGDTYGNIRTGAEILKQLYQQYGDWDLAARAYLAGNPYSTSKDALGTGVEEYQRRFDNNLAALGYGSNNAGTSGGSGTQAFWGLFGDNQFPITQPFGPTDETLEPSYDGYSHYHMGIDIGVPMGTPLYSPMHGKVIWAGDDPRGLNRGFGRYVVIQLDNGYTVTYGHMSSLNVKAGDEVGGGGNQYLGLSGSTGASTGPHTHIEVHDQNGNPVDPTTFFGF